MNNLTACRRCQLGLPSGARFCPWCGVGQARRQDGTGRKPVPSGDGGPTSGSPGDEKCSTCDAAIQPDWCFCAACGRFQDPCRYLSHPTLKVRIGKEALLLLCLAAVERFNEGCGPEGKGKGLEAMGLVLGTQTDTVYSVENIFPLTSADSQPEQVQGNADYLWQVDHLGKLCGVDLPFLGIFHSHPNGCPRVSEMDMPAVIEGQLTLVVGVDFSNHRKAWRWDVESNSLDGAVGRVMFSISAYTRTGDGIVRSLVVERA